MLKNFNKNYRNNRNISIFTSVSYHSVFTRPPFLFFQHNQQYDTLLPIIPCKRKLKAGIAYYLTQVLASESDMTGQSTPVCRCQPVELGCGAGRSRICVRCNFVSTVMYLKKDNYKRRHICIFEK
jgi:hypothetical protein